jgi:hypothetical protein
VKISPAQLETLKGNAEFKGLGEPGHKQAAQASPIPPGVDPKGFASGAEKQLQEAVAKTVGEGRLQAALAEKAEPSAKSSAPPEGFLNKATGEYAPRAGGFLDLASGRYVPPPAGSSFDANTGVFVPPRAMGSVDPSTGMYVPPKGVDLDPVKGFVAEAKPGPADARVLSSPGAAPPPPPQAVVALVTAMNTQSTPENSTKTVTMDSSFSAGGTAVSGGQQFSAPPPPPPSTPPPPPPPNTDPVADRPVSFNCATDNTCGGVSNTPPPVSTGVNFHINVTN